MSDRPTLTNWLLFATLSLTWAAAYAFTRMAVNLDVPEAGFPPQVVISIRLTVGALILLVIAMFSGQKWPTLYDYRSWIAIAAMGIVGTAAPFFLITVAQKTVDSSLAALYVAGSPLFVATMAHVIFHDEKMSLRKAVGIAVGFGGVAVLLAPDAIASFKSASVIAQAMCLLATVFYASSSIIARYARHIPPLVFSAGFVSFGAIATWPLLIGFDWSSLTPSTSAIVGVAGLTLGPTALASALYMILIQRTSATFLSLTGYTIPIISAIIGYLAFGETHGFDVLVALILILTGVWLTQRSSRPVS